VIARHRYVLGIHHRIVKLYTISEVPLITVDVETTYFITHASDDLQAEGDAKDKIVGGTMQK